MLKRFYEEEVNRGKARLTAYNRVCYVTRYYEYLEAGGLGVEEVGVRQAQGFQAWLMEKGRRDGKKYGARSINNYIEGVKSFYEFLKRAGKTGSNPFGGVVKVKCPLRVLRHIPREKELCEFLAELSGFGQGKDVYEKVRRYKLHVIAELLYATGMRAGEAARLREEDIDFQRGVIFVREGKGGKDRKAYLNEYARQVLKVYVEKMREVVTDRQARHRDRLFKVSPGRFIIMVNAWLKEFCKEGKLKEPKSHMFRHAFGFHLLRSGCDVRHIQALLGHARLKSTEAYTRVDKEDLRRVLDEFHPRRIGVR